MTLIRIDALVDEQEQHCVISGVEQLYECLKAVMPIDALSIQLHFNSPGTTIAPSSMSNIVILSLLHELRLENHSILEIKKRWVDHIHSIRNLGAPIFICTIFRHVKTQNRPDLQSIIVERIRQLNLMAIGLSHELGVGIVDIDRVMAHFGGRNLNSDFRLSSDFAADVAGHTLTWCLLSYGLDSVIDPTCQEKAKIVLGGVQKIPEIIQKRQAHRNLKTPIHG